MSLRRDTRPNAQLKLDFPSTPTGEAQKAETEAVESRPAVHATESPASTNRLMEEACERENLKEALRRVKANKGSPGVDGMTIDEITDYLKQHWPAIREQLLSGTYEPKPVRRVEIPKPDGGGVRKLGIPTVLDRFIQQAVMPAVPLGGGGTRNCFLQNNPMQSRRTSPASPAPLRSTPAVRKAFSQAAPRAGRWSIASNGRLVRVAIRDTWSSEGVDFRC